MNQFAHDVQQQYRSDPVQALHRASARIAPAWPLDSSIAVNPWWQWREQPMAEAAARLALLGGIDCLMPEAWYRDKLGLPADHDGATATTPCWRNFSALLDETAPAGTALPWSLEIEQQISQFCGLYATHEALHARAEPGTPGLYRAWLEVVRRDRGIEILMQAAGLHEHFDTLPDCPWQLTREMYEDCGAPEHFGDYCLALLLEINGWASWMAYEAWQARLDGASNDLPAQLLAIRLAWDRALWRHLAATDADRFALLRRRFLEQFERLEQQLALQGSRQRTRWQLQKTAERQFQQSLEQRLRRAAPTPAAAAPSLQAVFCIDVRSEPLRRALEAQHPGIATLGFAGFFGLPLEYRPGGSDYRRAQLPGLLRAGIEVTQETLPAASGSLHLAERCAQALGAAPSSLGLVEMFGLLKAGSLLRRSLFPPAPRHSINRLCHNGAFRLSRGGHELSLEEQAALAAGALTHMGLTRGLAPVVLLLGHGSSSTNNPQAAALDCGACGGQTGEVNVRVLAQLLNDPALRALLPTHGIEVPDTTRFIAGLHNTTTDEITLFGMTGTEPWQAWLQAATRRAAAQRATTLGMDPARATTACRARSRDWGELRPEWGLANNAAFIVAPRALTRDVDLEGRCFLHDYDWQRDAGFATLELIMTAPMIVTNWINLQYFASVTDNRKYGSGNKMLHNVTGGHIGVFEGNGGDLRIGLALQSVHDGTQWRHEPLRLSVYIAAPPEAITAIVARHEVVRDLVDNEWLYLLHLDPATRQVQRWFRGRWQARATEDAA